MNAIREMEEARKIQMGNPHWVWRFFLDGEIMPFETHQIVKLVVVDPWR